MQMHPADAAAQGSPGAETHCFLPAAEGIPCPNPALISDLCSDTHRSGENTGRACERGKQRTSSSRVCAWREFAICLRTTQQTYFCNHTKELERSKGQAGAMQLPGLCLMAAALESLSWPGGIQPGEQERRETLLWPLSLLQPAARALYALPQFPSLPSSAEDCHPSWGRKAGGGISPSA